MPVLDEASRPRTARRPNAPVTPDGRMGQRTLLAIHDHLREELTRLREAVDEVVAGRGDPAPARSLIHRLTTRQNDWSLGAFCAAYCRVLALHHAIEDERMFPDLRAAEALLSHLGYEESELLEPIGRLGLPV
ncbi:MAG TPA: hemerythrin domain-containing protein [Micromonosporaceae bacterium]|nr:hemerythrin domain-containing protein [Micromonosporaceae bacterium]